MTPHLDRGNKKQVSEGFSPMNESTNASGFGHYTRPANPNHIGPQELHQLSRWVMFKAVYDPLTGKLNKLPTTLAGQNASVSNPETWVS